MSERWQEGKKRAEESEWAVISLANLKDVVDPAAGTPFFFFPFEGARAVFCEADRVSWHAGDEPKENGQSDMANSQTANIGPKHGAIRLQGRHEPRLGLGQG